MCTFESNYSTEKSAAKVKSAAMSPQPTRSVPLSARASYKPGGGIKGSGSQSTDPNCSISRTGLPMRYQRQPQEDDSPVQTRPGLEARDLTS